MYMNHTYYTLRNLSRVLENYTYIETRYHTYYSGFVYKHTPTKLKKIIENNSEAVLFFQQKQNLELIAQLKYSFDKNIYGYSLGPYASDIFENIMTEVNFLTNIGF